MKNVKAWEGEDLKGEWLITIKVDGICLIVNNGISLSRANKPLYNLPKLPDGDYEIYLGNWENSMSAARTHEGDTIELKHIYSLDPIDNRLEIEYITDPSKRVIKALLKSVLLLGYEGLVLRQGDEWIKVKPTENFDVKVIGIKMGSGRNEGRVGSLITTKGNVGTGFTDEQREEFLNIEMGTIIEVVCARLTPNGKFRHSNFVRVREDKSEES